MNLVGYIKFSDDVYPLMVTSVKKSSVLYIVLSERPVENEFGTPRDWSYYQMGGKLHDEYILGMLDTAFSTSHGSTTLIRTALKLLSDVRTQAILSKNICAVDYQEIYTYKNSTIRFTMNQLSGCDVDEMGIIIHLRGVNDLNIGKRHLSNMLTTSVEADSVAQTTFLNSTLESLRLRGFDTAWFDGTDPRFPKKNYIQIHSIKEFDEVLVPDFIRSLEKFRNEPDWEAFLVTMDWEASGLDAWCELADVRVFPTFLGMSFNDHQAYGVFVNMEHFDNADNAELAKRLTNMFRFDPLVDREITIKNVNGSVFTYKRSEIKTSAHNLGIDVRFGLLIGADTWYDYCSMQIGFNTDPFLTRGHNGAKDRVEQFFGVVYAELSDICGKGHEGRFHQLSDIRVIMMYGCADVDWVRMFTKKMITGIRESAEYFGTDQIESFTKYDMKYMNYKSRSDYLGVRVDLERAKSIYQSRTNTLNQYYLFMRYYIAKVLKFKNFYDLYTALLDGGKDVTQIPKPDFNTIEPLGEVKWSGKFLLDVLFNVCQYPKLVWTKPNKKALASDKPFVPKLAVDKDAVKYYLKFNALKTVEQIDKALSNPQSLEEMKLASMYLSEDIIDTTTGKVIIKKSEFNKYRYPFFYVLQLIGPIEKSVSADLEPLVNLKSPYRFAATSTTSIVTRRDVTSVCTTSSDAKSLYLAYSDDYYFVGADQAAVEIRISFGLSGDRRLIDPLNNPEKDPHTEACSEFFNKPAYLVDRKKERQPIKAVNFGRIYLLEVWSCCKKIHDGETTPENLAHTAYLLELFDNARAPVHNALNKFRDECWQVRDVPEFLRWFLKMNPEKEYGMMQNDFKWGQHVEIREGDSSHEASMKRKAGNFAVQGLASTLLRILYTRFADACWAKGWIQDKSVIIHMTVYDEIILSFKKSINPYELIVMLRDSFVVRYRDFPILFLGINITHSWGETKYDQYELPVYLVERIKRECREGKHREPINEDYVTHFRKLIDDYALGRVKEVLLECNKGQKRVWWVEDLSKKFENYTVRGMLFAYKDYAFPVRDSHDPVEGLLSVLVPFISKYFLTGKETAFVVCRGKKILVTDSTHKLRFADESSLLDNKPLETAIDKKADKDEFEPEWEIEEIEYDFSDIHDFTEFDNIADEGTIASGETQKFNEDSLSTWDASFMKEYLLPEGSGLMATNTNTGKFDLDVYLESGLMLTESYENFVIRNGNVTIKCSSIQDCHDIINHCRGKYTTSTRAYRVYVSYRGTYVKSVGTLNDDMLKELDTWITKHKQLAMSK